MNQSRTRRIERLLRPTDGWKGFLFEILIVVIGVFLALVAQNWVEDRALARRLVFTERALALEISSSFYSANERRAIDECLVRQLRLLNAALQSTGPSWTAKPMFKTDNPGDLRTAFGAPVRSWPSDTWETATASEALAAMDDDRLNQYSRLYAMIRLIRQLQQRESELGPKLAILAHDGVIDGPTRTAMLADISALYHVRHLIMISSKQVLEMIDELAPEFPADRIRKMNIELPLIVQAFNCPAPPRIVAPRRRAAQAQPSA